MLTDLIAIRLPKNSTSTTPAAAPAATGKGKQATKTAKSLAPATSRAKTKKVEPTPAAKAKKKAEVGASSAADQPAVRQEPRVDELKPLSAAPGRVVVAVGEGFGKEPGALTVGGRAVKVPKANWTSERITFRVPPKARSGAVRIKCSTAIGHPTLTVLKPPTAAITATPVKGQEGGYKLSSDRSADEDGEITGRRWTAKGRKDGRGRTFPIVLAPTERRATVNLRVVDDDKLPGTASIVLSRTVKLPIPADVLFCFDCRKLDRDGRDYLRTLRQIVRSVRNIRIEGHTDNRGGHPYNDELSRDRARAVRRELLRVAGRQAPTITVEGFGKRRPVASNKREAGRRRNRRVTLFLGVPR